MLLRDRHPGQGPRHPAVPVPKIWDQMDQRHPGFILKSGTGTGTQIQNFRDLGLGLKIPAKKSETGTGTGTQNQIIRDSGPGPRRKLKSPGSGTWTETQICGTRNSGT